MKNTALWYAPSSNDISADEIHQTLAFGSLKDIQTLKKLLGIQKLTEIFLSTPKKVYTSESLHFIKNFILHVPHPIRDEHYLKFTSRHTR